jgi:hypothetical protein
MPAKTLELRVKTRSADMVHLIIADVTVGNAFKTCQGNHIVPRVNSVKLVECVECRAMLMRCFPHKSLLATFLSLSLLWVFVACVCLCARERSHISTQRVIPSSVAPSMIEGPPDDCSGCPLNSFPKATSPERAKLIINLEQAVATLGPLIASVFYSNPDILSGWRHGQLYTASPPLRLLPALRI